MRSLDGPFVLCFQSTAAIELALEDERAANAHLRATLDQEQAQKAAAEAVAEDAYREYRAHVARTRWKLAAAGMGVRDSALLKSPNKSSSKISSSSSSSSSKSSSREGTMRKAGSLEMRCEELEGQVTELRATLQVRCSLFLSYFYKKIILVTAIGYLLAPDSKQWIHSNGHQISIFFV